MISLKKNVNCRYLFKRRRNMISFLRIFNYRCTVENLPITSTHWAGKFFVRNPSKYLQIKCGTKEFRRFENEFQPFENQFWPFWNRVLAFGKRVSPISNQILAFSQAFRRVPHSTSLPVTKSLKLCYNSLLEDLQMVVNKV